MAEPTGLMELPPDQNPLITSGVWTHLLIVREVVKWGGYISLLWFDHTFMGYFFVFIPEAAETEGRRRLISKSFHHQLKYHNKQPLVGKVYPHILWHWYKIMWHWYKIVTIVWPWCHRSSWEYAWACGSSSSRHEVWQLEQVQRLHTIYQGLLLLSCTFRFL